MKILYLITQSQNIGGASIHLLDLAQEMQKKGHQVVVAAGGEGRLASMARDRDLRYVPLSNLQNPISILKDLLAVREFFRLMKKVQPDLVHLHSSKAGIVGRVSAFFARIPSVFTVHGWAFTEGVSSRKQKFYACVEKVMAPFAARIIAVSEYDKKLALKRKICPPSKIVAIHNGVSDSPGHPIHRIAEHTSEKVRIVMTARFENQKNQKDLILALSKIKHLDFIALFAGDGSTLESCKNLSQKLGLQEKILFLGHQDNVLDVLRSSDIYALITNWEGFPLSILEAMRECLPVVASDVGGISEQLDSRNGFLIPPGDIDQLAEKLELLITSSSLRHTLGENSRAIYLKDFQTKVMVDKTEKVYRDVLGVE